MTKENRIYDVHFVKGIIGTDEICTDDRPQYAFVGRSNVGKSSVINMLLNKKRLAKSSSTPGKTSEINFFLVNKNFYVVDLPGYGYAKVGKKVSEKFRKRILWYLTESGARPKTVYIILDARRGVTDMDKDMIGILLKEGHSMAIIVNKSDKLNQSEQNKVLLDIKNKLREIGGSMIPTFMFSAKTGKGKNPLPMGDFPKGEKLYPKGRKSPKSQ